MAVVGTPDQGGTGLRHHPEMPGDEAACHVIYKDKLSGTCSAELGDGGTMEHVGKGRFPEK